MNSIELLDNLDSYKAYMKNHKKTGSGADGIHEDKYQPEFTNAEKAELAEKLNASLQNHKEINDRISFSFDDQTKKFVMKIINSDTNEVVREIPSKDLRNIMMQINEFLGFFIDEAR